MREWELDSKIALEYHEPSSVLLSMGTTSIPVCHLSFCDGGSTKVLILKVNMVPVDEIEQVASLFKFRTDPIVF